MYQRILVPVDGSPTALKGLDEAVKLARLTGGALRLLYVVDELMFVSNIQEFSTYSADMARLLKDAGTDILRTSAERARAAGAANVDTLLIESVGGRVADVIVDQASQWKADVIVLGTHGRRGLSRIALGSDAELVVRASPLPVLLVRGQE